MRIVYRVSSAVAVLALQLTAAAAADLAVRPPDTALAPAATAPAGGFYAAFYGGVLMAQDPTATFKLGLYYPDGEINVDTGYRLGGAFGYDFNDNLGADVEVLYGSSNIGSIDVGAPHSASYATDGRGSLLTIMGNLTLGQRFDRWRPYIGVGAGAADLSLDADFASGLDDSDWTWGVQAFAGIDYEISKQVSLGGRYRFQYIGATDYSDGNSLPVHLDDFGISSFEAVLKWRIGG